MMKREILIIAKKLNTVTIPVEKPAENPAFAVSPNITVILRGPETAFVKSTPWNNNPKLLNVKAVVFPASTKPFIIAGKKE